MLSTRPAPRIALGAVSLLIVAYSLVIAQQILLGVVAVAAIWFTYLLFELIVTLGRIARALERLIEQRADTDTRYDG